MDHFAALNAFVAVADHGGFAPAARRLGLATSSLTRQVDALERHLGTVLVNRSTRSVTLTDAGARYAEDARRILDDLREADRGAGEIGGPCSGLLRVSLPVAFARLHVAPTLPAYLDANPEVEVELRPTDGVVNLVEERIDVAIRLGALEPSTLVARKLATHRRVVCAAPAYLDRHGAPEHPDALSDHQCLVFDYGLGTPRWHLARGREERTVAVGGRLRASGSEVLLEAALGGVGLVMLPTWLVGPAIEAGRLRVVLPDWAADPGTAEGGINAVMLPNRRGSRKVRSFVDHLARCFGTPPYWERG